MCLRVVHNDSSIRETQGTVGFRRAEPAVRFRKNAALQGMANQMRLIMSRIYLQKLLHPLLAGGYVAQPQMAQRFNKQAVLLMSLLR